MTLDEEVGGPLFGLRIDGELSLTAPTGARCRMVVDTLVAGPKSRLVVEAAGPEDGSIEIEFRPFDIEAHRRAGAPGWSPATAQHFRDAEMIVDIGAGLVKKPERWEVRDGLGVLGRHSWDPKQLSLGLVAHGRVRIAGRPKAPRIRLSQSPRRGEGTLVLAGEPAGWGVGDRVVITGTRYPGRELERGAAVGSQDEIREVVGVDGARVTLDQPLAFDHVPPMDGLSVYAVNLTRNVVFRSSEGVPLAELKAAAMRERATRLGHVKFMHTADVSVAFAAFDDLGRTDKTDLVDDFRRFEYEGIQTQRRRKDDHWVRKPDANITNRRGRYALHFHRTGATLESEVARVEGCVVTGGPGWGFVVHDSRADLIGNVAYGVLGAGFVAETGNETGTWEGNTAIYTYGADFNDERLDPLGVSPFRENDFDGTVLLEKRGAWKNHDFGHFGNGFWLQGKLIDLKNNVSVSSGLFGYFFMFRAPEQMNVDPRLLDEPLSVHRPDGVHPSAPGLNVFEDNQSIADRGGLIMIGIGAGRINDERSIVERFTAWEVGQTGLRSQYYPGFTIRNSTFLASAEAVANPTQGIYLDKVQTDTVLAHLGIEGFDRAYDLHKDWSPGTEEQLHFADPYEVIDQARAEGRASPLPLGYAQVVIDPGFSREEASLPHHLGETYRPEDTILQTEELVPGRFRVELDDASLRIDRDLKDLRFGELEDPTRPVLREGYVLLLRGTKTDSIGSIPIDYHISVLVWHEDAVQHRLETEGFYRMPSGDRGVLLEEVFADRYTGEKHVVRFAAALDPRWDLDGVQDRGEFVASEHPGVHVPEFLRGSGS